MNMEKEKRMTLLSLLAYNGCWQTDIRKTEQAVATAINQFSKELHFEKICWGPTAHKKENLLFSDSLMYILKDNEAVFGKNSYTLVIRGTNPFSLYSWIFQDLEVAGMTPWKRQSPSTASKTAYISKATDTALSIHKALKNSQLAQTVLEWLNNTVELLEPEEKIQLNVTGHSLGGLMSYVFALYLKENTRHPFNCSVYPIAAPTAGNKAFTKLCLSSFDNAAICIDNSYDIVTLVWNEQNMEKLPALYEKYRIKPNKLESDCITKLKQDTKGLGYMKLKSKSDIMIKPYLIPPLGDYILQAAYQHTIPYLTWTLLSTDSEIAKYLIQIFSSCITDTNVSLPDKNKVILSKTIQLSVKTLATLNLQ